MNAPNAQERLAENETTLRDRASDIENYRDEGDDNLKRDLLDAADAIAAARALVESLTQERAQRDIALDAELAALRANEALTVKFGELVAEVKGTLSHERFLLRQKNRSLVEAVEEYLSALDVKGFADDDGLRAALAAGTEKP